tara:strand:- start:126 stop:524 length:399 start_codon:yes stop_codon:yes gene_type:complete
VNFWEEKILEELSPAEWESLCDGCGKCCMVKLRDHQTDAAFYTDLACPLLDNETAQCSNYSKRRKFVPTCVSLAPENINEIDWLPETCGYVRVANGQPLEWWHPLVSGSRETVHSAGISVRGKTGGASIADG